LRNLDLGRVRDKEIDKLDNKLLKLWPHESGNGHNKNDGINYWRGKKILPRDTWRNIGDLTGSLEKLEYFPDQFFNDLLTYRLSHSEDPIVRERHEAWRAQFLELMEYKKDPGYGKEKCARCLLSTDREDAAIFMGINKVISRSLDSKGHTNTNTNTPAYPCPVLNRFECPYDKETRGDEYPYPYPLVPDIDVNHLFYLSNLAFAVELALAKAQGKEASYRITNAQDAYNALVDRRSLKQVLDQGLDEEHRQYKDTIIEFFMKMRDNVDINDLTVYPPPMYPSPS
jgi:hypothetical protein